MRLDFVRKDLRKYINDYIKPTYRTFDNAHNLTHFKFVTENCVNYARQLIEKGEDIKLELCYVIGAMHDIGIKCGRVGHAKSSAKIVREDKVLKTFFNTEEINIIAEAVEDHSSHLEYPPRSIYGKIVADADRNNTIYLVFSRPIKYGLKHERFRTKEGHINRVYEFVTEKFGRNGYVKYWLDIPDTTKLQKELWKLLDNEVKCKGYIEGLFDEITKGKYIQNKE